MKFSMHSPFGSMPNLRVHGAVEAAKVAKMP